MAENFTPEQKQEIEACIFSGQKIQAIKLLREATGVGLKEAKDAVEEYEATLRGSSPEKFKAAGKGCMACLVLMVAIAAPLAFYVFTTLE